MSHPHCIVPATAGVPFSVEPLRAPGPHEPPGSTAHPHLSRHAPRPAPGPRHARADVLAAAARYLADPRCQADRALDTAVERLLPCVLPRHR